MKILKIGILILVLIASSCTRKKTHTCDKHTKKGKCFIKIDNLRPTQYSLGMLSISSKVIEIESAYTNGKIEKFLKSKTAPAILGPDNNYYITDRHHTSFAITKASIPQEYKRLRLKILLNWSDLSFSEFEKRMIDNKYVWLRDEKHNEREFKDLPKRISDLSDDPYRSLAWKVRKEGGFNKVKVSYLEFYWGMFFKQNGIILSSSDPYEIDSVLKSAKILAKSKLSASLPGHK